MAKMAAPNVYLFYPNLIGFARVALGIASFCYMQSRWRVAAMACCGGATNSPPRTADSVAVLGHVYVLAVGVSRRL